MSRKLFALIPLSVKRAQVDFPQANTFRSKFNQLIVFNVLQSLFKAHLDMGRNFQVAVGS